MRFFCLEIKREDEIAKGGEKERGEGEGEESRLGQKRKEEDEGEELAKSQDGKEDREEGVVAGGLFEGG